MVRKSCCFQKLFVMGILRVKMLSFFVYYVFVSLKLDKPKNVLIFEHSSPPVLDCRDTVFKMLKSKKSRKDCFQLTKPDLEVVSND